jgi:chaperonin GroEL
MKNILKNNILIKDYKALDRGFLGACDAVAETMGAEGKFALMDNGNDAPITTKDGVSVAKGIRYSNKTENYGALQAITGAGLTLKKSGDSTTATMVFQQGYLRGIKRKKFNKAVERGIYKGVKEVYQQIDILSKEASQQDLEKIAITACNNDEILGKQIIEAYDYVGKGGIVEVIKGISTEHTKIIKQNGMKLENYGFSSMGFSNNDNVNYSAEKVAVICAEIHGKHNSVKEAVKSFLQINGIASPIIIFTEKQNPDLKEDFLEFKKIGAKNICHVGFTANTEKEAVDLLKDIATLSGAKVFDPTIRDSQVILGFCDKVVSSSFSTIISVDTPPKEISELLSILEEQEVKDFSRIKRLKEKSVLIEVGGLTIDDIKERFDRVEDAVYSVRNTMSDGFIAGGGSSLAFIAKNMNTKLVNKEEQRGYNLVKRILDEPFYRILKNANRQQKWFWQKNYIKHAKKTYGVGYNATLDRTSNLITDGVIDSAKSIKIALESATEIAIKMFNVGVIIHFPEKLTL